VSQVFVHRSSVATMAIDADIFAGMNNVPFAFSTYRVFLSMAGGT
jgi:hypothetical protein